jgi:hypothetical protein
MALTRQQERFLLKVSEAAEKLSSGLEEGEVLCSVYEDILASGSPPTDADCVDFIGFGLAEVAAFRNAVLEFVKLRDSMTPSVDDWGSSLNLVRSLQG